MKEEKVQELLEPTYDRDPKVRKEALRELCPCEINANVPQVWDRILEMAHDSDSNVRRIVLHLVTDGSPNSRREEILEVMNGMRNDPNPRVQKQVRAILKRYQRAGRLNP